MSATDKRRGGGSGMSDEGMLLIGGTGFVLLAFGALWGSMHLGHVLFGGPDPQANPVGLVVELVNGETPWTLAATLAAAVIVVGILAVLLAATVLAAQRHSGAKAPKRVDAAARHMGRGRDIATLSRKHVAATGRRLGVDVDAAGPGLRIGTAVAGSKPLYRSWEDVVVTIAGPRTGKTTAFVIPEIVEAPGAVIATSNKRDVVDATRHVRAAPGPQGHARQVWIFDPQSVVGDHQVDAPSWWWNPLSYVTSEVKAAQLAGVFFSAATTPGQSTHAYFTNAGRNLLAGLIYAAALDARPLSAVYEWVANPEEDEPARILAAHDKQLIARSVRGVIRAAPEQRSGVFGTAQEVVSFMTNDEAMVWVTPPATPGRVEFHPRQFVTSRDTLYSLSREGNGNAGPLVTALTVAVCEAAEDHAKTSPGGRLETPMVVSLDEAANVCRWHDLPDLYSHYGSRGILVSTYLQSWSQGAQVWGREGIRKLWSAANVNIYAGGVNEGEYLKEISMLGGEYRAPSRSVSTGKNGRSVSTDSRLEPILNPADLAELERGRAIVMASGSRAVIMRTEPWMEGPHAAQIRASIETSTAAPVRSQAVHSTSAWANVARLDGTTSPAHTATSAAGGGHGHPAADSRPSAADDRWER